ncbi:MAG TPA: glycosyltransferase family 4 protein [Gemmatimonadaceae bacterium]
MKICFICYEYPPGLHGGVGTFTQVLARALVRLGHQVRVIGVYPANYAAPDYEEDEGVHVWRLRESGKRFAWIGARYRLHRVIRRWVRSGEIDLIESPDCYGWYMGWRRMSVPLVARAHGSLTYFAHELGQPIPRTGGRLEALSYAHVDAWIAVSAHTGDVTRRLFALPSGPDAVIYNPVEGPSPLVPYMSRTPGHVAFAGTLTAKKGIEFLIDAWPEVFASHPEATLHVYGKGSADGSTEARLAQRLPVPTRSSVHFHGHVDRPTLISALSQAQVAVFPSLTETFGLCAVESMACGCPTIYTKLSCGPEIVRDGTDGLLVDPRSPSEIARAIITVLDDPQLGQRLACAGPRRVRESFSLDAVIPENVAFYERAVREKRES